MKIPLSWLREFVAVTVEARRLGEDLTMVGLALEGLESDAGDAILDLDVTTNRVDCMNVYGVAREVAVLYGLKLKPLPLDFPEAGRPATDSLEVSIEARELCPRFCARVLEVQVGPSPGWLRDRLAQVGVRPINNVVDLSNYVMMEMGHPSHAFDLERIPGARLHVRWAREGERLVTLDGAERTLTSKMGVVAGEGALALAGIMGGAASEVSDSTRTVALEAAYWDPLATRRTARALGMHTEASHRFERGADPEAASLATARVAHLLQKIQAGRTRPGLIDARGAAWSRRRARLRASRIPALLGTEIPAARVEQILTGLGFESAKAEGGRELDLQIPSWRGDVVREVDVIEEVARHHGLSRIPSALPPARLAGELGREAGRERLVRELLVGAGLTEAVNYGFVAGAQSVTPEAQRVRLLNPLSADFDVLRGDLLVPGLLANLATNLRHGRREVALFEIGRVFAPGSPLPNEERRLGLLLTGARRPRHWSEASAPVDFFAVKGLLEALGQRLGARLTVADAQGVPAHFHPGRSATVRLEQALLGFAGALHPDVCAGLELRAELVGAELSLEPLLAGAEEVVRYRALERFPAASRDLSLLCAETLPAEDLQATIRRSAGPLLRSVALVDRYRGDPVPDGHVSLTVSLRFQDASRTLTNEEVESAIAAVGRELRAAGVEIRGE